MIIGKQLVVIARFGKLVAKFDQQPVFALAAAAIVETYQYPAAFELFTVKNEFEFAVTECLLGIFITERRPITTIPQHHGAAAVLAFRNGPFEIPIVEWVVFDFDRQPLHVRIEGRALCNRP